MIQEIADRLTELCPSLASVGTAEDLDALDKGTAPRSGTAFVIPFLKDAAPNTLATGGIRQRVEVRFLVAFLVRRHDSAKGGKRVAEFETFENEITDALLGWTPTGATDRIQFVSARGAPRGNGVTIYVQTWQTALYLRKT